MARVTQPKQIPPAVGNTRQLLILNIIRAVRQFSNPTDRQLVGGAPTTKYSHIPSKTKLTEVGCVLRRQGVRVWTRTHVDIPYEAKVCPTHEK